MLFDKKAAIELEIVAEYKMREPVSMVSVHKRIKLEFGYKLIGICVYLLLDGKKNIFCKLTGVPSCGTIGSLAIELNG